MRKPRCLFFLFLTFFCFSVRREAVLGLGFEGAEVVLVPSSSRIVCISAWEGDGLSRILFSSFLFSKTLLPVLDSECPIILQAVVVYWEAGIGAGTG